MNAAIRMLSPLKTTFLFGFFFTYCAFSFSADDPLKSSAGEPPLTGPDDFGYTFLDETASECHYQFVDIETTGSLVVFTPSGSEPALDDGAAVISLVEPFQFYGSTVSNIVISTNGYLAPGANLAQEDGGDFSNDCEIPAIPGNANGKNGRMMVIHDDLTGETGPGAAYHQYFQLCPRSPGTGIDGPCTVIQWTDWAVRGNGDLFDFQAILYHQNDEFAFQVAPPVSVDGATATLGIQDPSATTALSFGCDSAGFLVGDTALCFFNPHAPGRTLETDLSISLTSPTQFAIPNAAITYDVQVTNLGSGPVNLADVALTQPLGTGPCRWICTSSRGSSCPMPHGEGPLDLRVSLDPGRTLDFRVFCDLPVNISGSLEGEALVSTPALFSDTNLFNNSHIVAVTVCPFPKGFFPALANWPQTSLDELLGLLPNCEFP